MQKTVYFAGGCFWGVQRFFDQFTGVIKTEAGYANGGAGEVTYEQVCASSGHAETVKIDFDDEKISIEKLLGYYFMAIDPLSVNKQGGDEGIQYRTGIYYTDAELEPRIKRYCELERIRLGAPLAVEVLPLSDFCIAEEYHQKYLDKNPSGYCHLPKALFELEPR